MLLYFSEIIKGKHKGIFPSLLRAALYPLSLCYQAAVIIRHWAFDTGLLKEKKFDQVVTICIGNIVAGGTGKTPLTLFLGQHFSKTPIVILSRGYLSKNEKKGRSTFLNLEKNYLEYGDEPYLLAKNLPSAQVIVGPNRQQSAQMAIQSGAKLLILDDGFQHRYLKPDFNLVILKGSDLFGRGYYLPRGFLRDTPKALKRANLILVNQLQDGNVKEIRHYSEAPIVGFRLELEGASMPNGKLQAINSRKIGVFCGIGDPEQFIEILEKNGAIIVAAKISPDHQLPALDVLQNFSDECKAKGAEFLLCTEKDFVKLSTPTSLPIAWLKSRVCITSGQEQWDHFLENVSDRLVYK